MDSFVDFFMCYPIWIVGACIFLGWWSGLIIGYYIACKDIIEGRL